MPRDIARRYRSMAMSYAALRDERQYMRAVERCLIAMTRAAAAMPRAVLLWRVYV